MEEKYCYQYPRPAVTTDCVIFGFDGQKLQVLLIERGGEPFKGRWAFPGGFLNMDETVEECAARELEEETGMKDVFADQFHAFSAIDRDPRGRTITVAFYALVDPRGMKVSGQDDAADARWYDILEMPSLAFDHEDMFWKALQQLKVKVYLQLSGFEQPDKRFAAFDLKRVQTLIPDKI
ncbi:NUDIX hydrolase [Butyricimonas sp.]|uniref:NUDIX hydrolase n=1 Tax=Butyricimonas sp. TaxID=1969738 RepID=UPI0025C0FE2F|nr:NUDIX hydrolase [Butyricimonas sp.]